MAGVRPLRASESLFLGRSRSGKPRSTPYSRSKSNDGNGGIHSPPYSGCSVSSESKDFTERRRKSGLSVTACVLLLGGGLFSSEVVEAAGVGMGLGYLDGL